MTKQDGDIKVVFFDLGKVILRFNHENIVERLLSKAPPDKRRPRELHEFLFDMKDGLCNQYDEGVISSRGFFEEIDRRFDVGASFEEFSHLWDDIFTEDTEVTDIVRAVRRTRPVFLLSNVNELHWEFIKGRFSALSEMDGWVLSYEVKAKKPNPAIYRAAMDAAGVGEGESLFIDDLDENIKAARAHGIRGITFMGAGPLADELSGMGLIG